jgi:hypothetical protein
MGVDENTIGSIFSKYYAPETSQPTPQALTPPPPNEPRYQPPQPPEKPIYEEPRLYEEPRRPDRPDMPEIYPEDYAGPRTTGSTQTQQVGPRTSYRQEADGTLTEIGYNGDPISGYTPEQMAIHNATTGVTPPEYRYVWNGQGYDKVPNGPQTGYGPTPDIAEPKFPERERPPEQPRYEDPRKEQEAEEGRRKQEIEDLRREQESIARQREAEEYYFRMRNAQSEQPRYEEPIAPQMPYYPDTTPMPETYIEPEVNFPTDPGFYQPPVDYYNPSPPMDFTQDPGFAPTPTPIGIAKSLQGGDIGKLLQDLTSRSGGQQSEGLAALIAKALARNGGGGSLDEQRRLMELLGSIRG